MPVVASGVIVGWPSTNASIPSGWSEETGLSSKYVRGAAAGADADLTSVFGGATHSHTSPNHQPLGVAHNHTFSAGSSSGTVAAMSTINDDTMSAHFHSHAATTGANTTSSALNLAITVNATSNDLAYKEVIWIKSDGSPTGIPSGAYAMFADDSLPPLWSRVMGNYYPKGAAGSGDGGATGGSNTHTHTSPAHTHLNQVHRHTGNVSSNNTESVTFDSGSAVSASLYPHTHTGNTSLTTITNQSVTTTLSTDSHEPPFKKLNIISNGNASADMPDKIIAVWGGTHAGVPSNWTRYTAMDDNFLKGCNANGEVGSTGGATTHTHTASNCLPIQNPHTHTLSPAAGATHLIATDAAGAFVAAQNHTHTWTVSTETATYNAATVTINANTAESAYPVYAKVIFIQWTLPVSAVRPRPLTGTGL
jgi:hypothetical protein